jgi:hypothetical protein
MTHERKWRPLHVAIAWALTRDEQFCCEIAGDKMPETIHFMRASGLSKR